MFMQNVSRKTRSMNGASGVYPGCTDLAYKQAVDDGADIIDCSVQMSKDGVAFCLDSPDLSVSTTAMPTFMSRSTMVPEFLTFAKESTAAGILINIQVCPRHQNSHQ